MKLKRIISGLTAGVIAASIGVSAFAAAPTVTWSNGPSLTSTKGGTKEISTASLDISAETVATATFTFDLLLMGYTDKNTGATDPSYLALKSGDNNVISIECAGWSSTPCTVNGTTIIGTNNSEAHSYVITLDFVNDTYTVKGTAAGTSTAKEVNGTLTVDSITGLELYAANTTGGNKAKIEKLSITTQDITAADAYEYTNDENLANTDAKGFTAQFTVEGGNVVNSLTWYLKKGEGSWKTLTAGTLPEISGDGTAKIGLIVYNLPKGVSASEISAGYTYTSSAQTGGAE